MKALFDKTSVKCSKLITQHYSTSFSLGIRTLDKKFHDPIYAIYAFVRYADEIVDTFHDFDKKTLLAEFKADAYRAIEQKISLNPVLNAFQWVVNRYGIEHHLIEAFLKSMETDLEKNSYQNDAEYGEYIYGSAEVVGLMCLHVFCEGNVSEYGRLKSSARCLGSAFQKVNFLRDLKSDFDERGRVYFPNLHYTSFNAEAKKHIEEDIERDFAAALAGIQELPESAKFGVYVAYVYYLKLFHKIKASKSGSLQTQRIRVPDFQKLYLMIKSYFKFRLNYI
jgi:phytoene/squalene synthetase